MSSRVMINNKEHPITYWYLFNGFMIINSMFAEMILLYRIAEINTLLIKTTIVSCIFLLSINYFLSCFAGGTKEIWYASSLAKRSYHGRHIDSVEKGNACSSESEAYPIPRRHLLLDYMVAKCCFIPWMVVVVFVVNKLFSYWFRLLYI